MTLRSVGRGGRWCTGVATLLLSATRLPLPREARGFASPPRGGLAFVVGTGFIPRNVNNTQHVVQKATTTGALFFGPGASSLLPCRSPLFRWARFVQRLDTWRSPHGIFWRSSLSREGRSRMLCWKGEGTWSGWAKEVTFEVEGDRISDWALSSSSTMPRWACSRQSDGTMLTVRYYPANGSNPPH